MNMDQDGRSGPGEGLPDDNVIIDTARPRPGGLIQQVLANGIQSHRGLQPGGKGG